jgi:hypothetical protein
MRALALFLGGLTIFVPSLARASHSYTCRFRATVIKASPDHACLGTRQGARSKGKRGPAPCLRVTARIVSTLGYSDGVQCGLKPGRTETFSIDRPEQALRPALSYDFSVNVSGGMGGDGKVVNQESWHLDLASMACQRVADNVARLLRAGSRQKEAWACYCYEDEWPGRTRSCFTSAKDARSVKRCDASGRLLGDGGKGRGRSLCPSSSK